MTAPRHLAFVFVLGSVACFPNERSSQPGKVTLSYPIGIARW